MISQVHKDFPVYVISNDDPLSTEEKAIIVDMAPKTILFVNTTVMVEASIIIINTTFLYLDNQ